MKGQSETPTPARVVSDLLAEGRPLVWLFTGDSVTQGACHTFGWRDYTELFAERVRWELGRLRDVVINTAVSGRTVADLESDLEWSVLRHQPDVVLLMFGLNDCVRGVYDTAGFQHRLEDLVVRITSESDARVVLQTPNLSGPGDLDRQAALSPFVETIRALAETRGLPLVDHAPVWQEASDRNMLEHWIAHGCHPNEFGHRALARQLLTQLGLANGPSRVLDLYVP